MKQTPFERIMSQMATVKQYPIDLQPITPAPTQTQKLPSGVFPDGAKLTPDRKRRPGSARTPCAA